MVTRYWLQYHNYDENGFPGKFVINTNKELCKEIVPKKDIIFLMVGASESDFLVEDFEFDVHELEKIINGKVYFLWEKFVAAAPPTYLGEKQFGDYDYEVLGCSGEIFEPPILLTSPEFYSFWYSYHRHGLLCLSNIGCPFPELEQTKENFRYGSRQGILRKDRVFVSPEVYQGIDFLLKARPTSNLYNCVEVINHLRQHRFLATAKWIHEKRDIYILGIANGFEVLK